jgi:hypothetical protein
MNQPKLREKYWSTVHSTESEIYGENYPCTPWYGVITKSFSDMVQLSFYNEESKRVDLDSNASAYIYLYQNKLFLTQEEAWLDYQHNISLYILSLEEKLIKWKEIENLALEKYLIGNFEYDYRLH